MRAVVQRVLNSSVEVDKNTTGKIDRGITVLLGVEDGDSEDDAAYMAEKCVSLRIFEDEDGKMNLSVKDVGGEILAISQFTLLGECKKGRRPNFMAAARPAEALKLYNIFVDCCKRYGVNTETGVFGAHMLVRIENDGPVTILLDSRKLF